MTPRVVVVILCGAGDRPIARLGGRTPLDHAVTENLDRLAREGTTGLVTVIDERTPPESDSGAMALLGYDPLVHYTGRGPLEGLGIGFWDDTKSCVAFRVNFASSDADSGRLDRRTARDLSDDELQQLAAELRAALRLQRTGGVDWELHAFARHRGIVCLTSESARLSGNVSNTDPGFRRIGAFGVPNERARPEPLPCAPLDDDDASALTAAAVNEFVALSARILADSEVNRRRVARGKLPANVILFRDGGHEIPELDSFRSRTGLTMALYGQVPAERALCALVGGRFVHTAPRPGQSDDDFYVETARAVACDPADVVLAHLKGPDEPGHDDDPAAKSDAIAAIDRVFVSELLARTGRDVTLVFTADHATPCEVGIHVADPVPTLVWRHGGPRDTSTGFCEREAARGGLGVERACELLQRLVEPERAPR